MRKIICCFKYIIVYFYNSKFVNETNFYYLYFITDYLFHVICFKIYFSKFCLLNFIPNNNSKHS